MDRPTAFISYSWDSEIHKEWVRLLANDLMRHGIPTILDEYDLPVGGDRFKFMERSISDSAFIICVCTPKYVRRADSREGGVGIEASIMTPELFENSGKKVFVPLIRAIEDGCARTPTFMKHLRYMEFMDDAKRPEQLDELVRLIYQRPRLQKPPLGPTPAFVNWETSEIERLKAILARSQRSFKFLRDRASFRYTDDQFKAIIRDYSDVFADVVIKRYDADGNRAIPGNPGIRLK